MSDLTLTPEFKSRIQSLVAASPNDQKITQTFPAGTTLVNNGAFSALIHKHIENSSVPLSLITEGHVSVIQNGKAIKYLSKGDAFGVFETAYYLKFGQGKTIGRWTLVADTDVTLDILTDTYWAKASEDEWQSVIQATATNHELKPLTRLDLLDGFAHQYNVPMQNDTAVIFHSHVLETSVDLLKHIGHVVGEQNTFILEKPYSTIPAAYRKVTQTGVKMNFIDIEEKMPYAFSIHRAINYVWDTVSAHARKNNLSKIVIISDGGNFTTSVPWKSLHGIDVVAVEQTQSGIDRIRAMKGLAPATFNIAETRAKKTDEAVVIGEATATKIDQLEYTNRSEVFGIIGYGSIGKAIADALIALGEKVLVYETNQSTPVHTKRIHSLEELVEKSSVIIGTTGTDVLKGMYLERLQGHKIFMSASSENLEFGYLFDNIKKYPTTFEDIHAIINEKLKITILNGGYPINFDRNQEWEPAEDIVLTRMLMYAGFLQALTETPTRGTILPLRGDLEHEILESWKLSKIKGRQPITA